MALSPLHAIPGTLRVLALACYLPSTDTPNRVRIGSIGPEYRGIHATREQQPDPFMSSRMSHDERPGVGPWH